MLDPQSNPDVPHAVWVALYTSFTNNLYYSLAGITFVVYEYIITFDREVSLFWRRRFTGATLLFLLNRYITLLTQIMDSFSTSKVLRSDERFAFNAVMICSLYNQVGSAIDISQYIVWAAFAALRALALSRHRPLSAFIFMLSLVPVGINFAKYGFQLEGETVNIFNLKGCSGLDFVPDALQRKTSLIAADVILVLITWYTLPQAAKVIFKPNPGGNDRPSIATTLLQNGTIYFLVLITLNTLHLVFTIAQVFEIAAGGNFSQLTLFTEPATSILVSRFLCNLQEASRDACDQVESNDVTGSSVVFGNGSSSTIDRVLGSIGSSLISTGSVDSWQDRSDAILAAETGRDGGSQRLETDTT